MDIAGNGAVQKGMPHKFYHGKTGLVWNVTPRAVGVQVNKRVGNRIIPKRLHVRVEHVKHSKSRKDFLERVIRNEELKNKAKAGGGQSQLRTTTLHSTLSHRHTHSSAHSSERRLHPTAATTTRDAWNGTTTQAVRVLDVEGGEARESRGGGWI